MILSFETSWPQDMNGRGLREVAGRRVGKPLRRSWPRRIGSRTQCAARWRRRQQKELGLKVASNKVEGSGRLYKLPAACGRSVSAPPAGAALQNGTGSSARLTIERMPCYARQAPTLPRLGHLVRCGTLSYAAFRMLRSFVRCRVSHVSEFSNLQKLASRRVVRDGKFSIWLRVLPRRSIPVAGGTDRVSSKTRNHRNALGPESRIPGRVGKLSIPYLGNSGRDGKFRRMENSGDECNRAEADSSAESSSDKILLLLNNNPLMSLMSRIPYKFKLEGV